LLRMIVSSEIYSRLESAVVMEAAEYSSATRRELLLSMSSRQLYPIDDSNYYVPFLTQLFKEYEPGDRWYLEAIGIACDGRWDELAENMKLDDLTPQQRNDILWRSRFSSTPEALCEILQSEELTVQQAPRYVRALDFFRERGAGEELLNLASSIDPQRNETSEFVFLEALKRLPATSLDEELKLKVDTVIASASPAETIRLVGQFQLGKYTDKLLGYITADANRQLAIDAARVLSQLDTEFVNENLVSLEAAQFELLADALAGVRSPESTELLKQFALNVDNELERRKRAVLGMAKARQGAEALLRWMESQRYDRRLEPAISAAMHGSQWNDVVDVARTRFPMPAGREAPLPSVRDLLRLSGDAGSGLEVYRNAGTCAKCHMVNGEGTEVGPDLSEIGSKLSRQAMFESILFPSAGISHGYEQWTVLTADGDQLDGLVISETDDFIELKDKEGVVRRIPMENIEARRPLRLSLMPADLHKELSEQELADLVEYLMQRRNQP
ncbi:MAG: c-type cytochrome, partial [Planctomycetota bacterium]